VLLDFFADDAVMTSAPGAFRGREGVAAVLGRNLRVTSSVRTGPLGVGLLAKGNVAVREVVFEATWKGIRYEYPDLAVLEFGDDGKTRAYRSYYDKRGIEQRIAAQFPDIQGWLFRPTRRSGRLAGAGAETGVRAPHPSTSSALHVVRMPETERSDPMVTMSERSTPTCLVVDMVGAVTGEEYDDFADRIEDAIEKRGTVDLVVDLAGSVKYGDLDAAVEWASAADQHPEGREAPRPRATPTCPSDVRASRPSVPPRA
jgi:hypothetical protein